MFALAVETTQNGRGSSTAIPLASNSTSWEFFAVLSPRTLSFALVSVALAPLFASSAAAQYQALAAGERVISVGPTIPPQSAESQSPQRLPAPPCTVDCERAALAAGADRSQPPQGNSVLQIAAPQNSAPATDTDANSSSPSAPRDLNAGSRELDARFRQMNSQYQHDLNQANQRIEHLSKQLQLSEQKSADKPADAPQVKELQATIAAMKAEHAQQVAAADRRLKTLVDEISVGLAASRKEMQQREAKAVAMQQSLKQDAARRIQSAEEEIKAKTNMLLQSAEQLENAKKELAAQGKNLREMATNIKTANGELQGKAKSLQEMAEQLQRAKKSMESRDRELRELEEVANNKAELAMDLEKQRQTVLKQLDQANDKNRDLISRQKAFEKEIDELHETIHDLKEAAKKRKPKKKRDSKK